MKDSTRKKVIIWFWALLSAGVLAVAGLLAAVWIYADIPSFSELEHPNNNLATQLISVDGEVISTFHIENRTYVQYQDISPKVINAAIATEDSRFEQHCGIDFQSLGRVLFRTLLMGDSSQGGGSTITQQLAKTLYPRQEMSNKLQMVWIKLREWATAIKLERSYTKNEIVAMYLNSVFFGSGAYGIKAASETYFSKQPSELNIQEAATLIGIINKPTRYNPVLHYDQSKSRRDLVISRMHKGGYITEEQMAEAHAAPIELRFQVQDHNSGIAPYFRDMIRREMSAKEPRRNQYLTNDDYVADTIRWR